MNMLQITSSEAFSSAWRRGILFCGVVFLALAALPHTTHAQILEPGFESEVVATGFTLPTAAAFAPDGRIFVAEKGGAIKVVKSGAVLPTPLVILTDVNTFGDRGLLGLAVDPDFAANGYIYVLYTHENAPGGSVAAPKTGRIVRLTVEGDTASESTKVVLVGSVGGTPSAPSCEDYDVTSDCIASDSNSHSVGGLRFGPDGKLYATLGDGADFAAADPRAMRAQNVDALAGKMLRINTDGTGPSDNPFYDGDPNSNRSKVYALGLRNTFRFNFNESTGKLYGGDVGWGSWEEVNEIVAGANYGWPCREGAHNNVPYACTPSSTSTDPLYEYSHDAAGAGSITAGAFFTNGVYPVEYETSFFMADYAQMWMKRLVLDTNGDVVSVEDFIDSAIWPVEILTGLDGNIYYIDIVTTDLVRITHTDGNRRPVVSIAADPTSGLAPLLVNFSSTGTVDPDSDPISYLWNFGDGTTSNSPNPTHSYSNNGRYTASLVVTDSLGAESVKSLDILVGDQAPTAQILSPASGALYKPLENVTVTGGGIDPEDGTLPASAFSWTVLLHHNTHVHTVQQFSGTKSIVFVADDHQDTDVYMEVILEVTDSAGLTNETSINMYLDNGVGSGNLISNPSLEIESVIPDIPLDWYESLWGVMSVNFSYPVAGFDGARAGEVSVNNYESGAAKWLFAPVAVTEGKEYTFTNRYTATVPTDLLAQYGMADGSHQYDFFAVVPASATVATNTVTFTVPTGAKTVTVFHEITRNGTLRVDDYSLQLKQSNDTTPPSGTITSPADGEVVSGLVNVTVDATDNIGVTKMHLYVDGAKFGYIEDTAAPWEMIWDTTLLPNGTYAIQAHMHDAVDNHGLSPAVTVTVDNGTTSTPNLITNGDFEIVGTDGNPVGWTPGGWGTNTRVHSYPVPGSDGGIGAEVTITNYGPDDTGDARWSHTPVAVTSGTKYLYESMYKATTISDVLGRYTFADGSEHFFGLIKEIPGTADWTKISGTFVPPAGAETVTFGHAIGTKATVTIDEVGLFEIGTGTPSEINAPSINIISPSDGDTLSGTVSLLAESVDDTEVVGVYFAVDGTPYGLELTTAPYTLDLDTTDFANGTHILKATTHDIYGNNDKQEITITIDNTSTPPPSGDNLALNSDLELDAGNGTPQNWRQGGWGTNDRIFTYPAPGASGSGAKVEITSYSAGDAKWYFDDVLVSANTDYTVGDSYNSTVESNVYIRYTSTSGGTTYAHLISLPATGGAWQSYSETITTPSDTQSLTVFHVIAGIGELTVDDYVLTTDTPPPTDTTPPSVSVDSPLEGDTVTGTISVRVSASDVSGVDSVELLVDGSVIGVSDTTAPYTFAWDSTTVSDGGHTISARAADNFGNSADATVVNIIVDNTAPPPSGDNLVSNSDLELDAGNGTPQNWRQGGWGTNDRIFTYPAPGASGSGAKVEITSYSAGDAKWYFDDVTVDPDTLYNLTHMYNSNISSAVILRYTLSDSSYSYQYLDAVPSSSGTWQTYVRQFTTPSNASSVTVFHVIAAVGEITTDDFSLMIAD